MVGLFLVRPVGYVPEVGGSGLSRPEANDFKEDRRRVLAPDGRFVERWLVRVLPPVVPFAVVVPVLVALPPPLGVGRLLALRVVSVAILALFLPSRSFLLPRRASRVAVRTPEQGPVRGEKAGLCSVLLIAY